MNLLIKILSIVFPILFVTVKYCMFMIQADSVKKMLERMQDDWRLLKNKLEVDIIETYAYNIQFSSIVSIVIVVFCSFLLFILQFLPLILDVILPLNNHGLFELL
ncbi:uncharacterized protein LOC112637628 [Camponotus floridanus]|uniref:uncharacterized protein LOC112637628 n=1 Tax=Camponotus floridanus TaxID=104421 RepID=UPI000DC68542|nr:uncharacterized protein LOC112637628 [Camponotus floridanus]